MRNEVIRTKICPTGHKFNIRTHSKISLGPMCLEICSNERDFSGLRHFPSSARAPAEVTADYIVNLCNLGLDGPWRIASLEQERDRCYRANRFAMGYYLTDHFGTPAYLMARERELWIFTTDSQPILWPYVVKHLLTIYSMQHGMLHLKAASLAINNRGTLLVAKGGGGKTHLLAKLCQAGAHFAANTHTLIDDKDIIPVSTALRVRNDTIFGPLITEQQLPPAIKPGEFTADPVSDLKWKPSGRVAAHNICLVDYRSGQRIIRELDKDTLFDYMEQFSLALNVYGLKEDILDFLNGDVSEFSVQTRTMRTLMRDMIGFCRCYYISCDSMDGNNLNIIYDMLAQ